MAARPPALDRVRLATVDDAPLIMEMVNESMAMNFRIQHTSQIAYLIERSVLAICQINIEQQLVGFMSARDYPLIPSVHSGSWEYYIWNKYKTIEMNARNTLFLHLLCWNTKYSRDVVDSMLRSMYMHDPYIQYVAVIKTLRNYPLLVQGQARAEASFRRVQAMERGIPGELLPGLCISERREVCPRLRIRRAVEEDNDDLLPIIERHSEQLRALYGDYYVSELISRHPDSERVLLVCEHKELAVGVMCLNTQINFESMEDCYELSPFAGLRRVTGESRAERRGEDTGSDVSLFTDGSCINQQTLDSDQLGDYKSKVTWVFGEDDLDAQKTSPQPSDKEIEGEDYEDLVNLNWMEEDEEEVEFDIINIDPALMRVSDLLTPTEKVHNNTLDERQELLNDKKKEVKKSPLNPAMGTSLKNPEPVIRYTGPSNAFLLELFAIHPDYDERVGFDMLEVAYELFPERSYCVLCLPSNHTSYPLLEHFTLVAPRCSNLKFINDSLYVAHINSVRGDVRVRAGEGADLAHLSDVLEHAPRRDALVELFETSLRSRTLQAFTFLAQNQPIGMFILGPLEDGTSIRTQYDLEPEPQRPGTDCTASPLNGRSCHNPHAWQMSWGSQLLINTQVLAGVMSPALEPHSRWFLREVLRLSRYSTMFWICQPMAKGEASPSRNLMSLVERMAPVRPRRSLPNISGNKDLDKLFKDLSTPFALWMIETPITSLPKVYVNNKIVVVGASRTGLAFLEKLMMGPTSKYLTFTNLSLVSEHGLPTVAECLRAADTCVPRDGRYTDRYIKSIPFYFYLDILSAVMVRIDRKNKCIHLKGGGIKFYDELVLTCGQQFQHPEYLKASLEHVKEMKKGKPCERILMDDPKYVPDHMPHPPELPENVFLINCLYQANICLRKLLRMVAEDKESLSQENPIVVYGDCVEAYCCISALLELGLAAKHVVFIEPFPPESPGAVRVNCFNDEIVDERVQSSLESLGIKVVRRCRLACWRAAGARVTALRLMAPLHCLELPCYALFYYGLKAIDLHAFKAINECGLVYDGGLIVGPAFDTNDPLIFAAGTCVQYSRRLYAARRLQRYYCSEDVGEALAHIFLRKMDPFVMCDPNAPAGPLDMLPKYSSSILGGPQPDYSPLVIPVLPPSRRWQPVMKFESPIVQSAVLPGPLHYMKLRRPGLETPREVQLTLPRQGHTLVTDKRGNYFRLQLNVLHCVDAVTCLSKKPFSAATLSQLYGSHEVFFNKLLYRYQMGLIEDLYDFFTQPWMAALYQETFLDLLNSINHQDVGTVYDLIKSKFTFDDDDALRKLSSTHYPATCSDVPECGYGPEDAKKLGTFRSVIDKYIGDRSQLLTSTISKRKEDVPSECGQALMYRGEAAGFWSAVNGDAIVTAHIARYLARNSVTNPHYATPNATFF